MCSTQYGLAGGGVQAHDQQEWAAASKLANKHASNVFWDGVERTCRFDKVNIISVDSDWVRYGQGRNDRFRNVRTAAGGFVINATELRSVNFSMQAVDRAAAIYTVTETRQACLLCCTARSAKAATRCSKDIDSEIRAPLLVPDVCYLDFSLRHCLSNSGSLQAYLYF